MRGGMNVMHALTMPSSPVPCYGVNPYNKFRGFSPKVLLNDFRVCADGKKDYVRSLRRMEVMASQR